MRISLLILFTLLCYSFSYEQSPTEKKTIYHFGASYYQFTIVPSDRVMIFQEASNESGGQFGLRFSIFSKTRRRSAIVNDFEFDFGTFNRKGFSSGSSGTISLQYYLGFNTKLKENLVSLNTLVGLNFLWISGQEGYEVNPHSNYQEYYYGDDAWVWNSIGNGNSDPYYVNGYQSFSMLAPAINLSLNIDVAYPLILSIEYIGILNSGIRNNIRISLLFAIEK